MKSTLKKLHEYIETFVIASVFMGLLAVFISAFRSQVVKRPDMVYFFDGAVSIQWLWVLTMLGLFLFVLRQHINERKNNPQ